MNKQQKDYWAFLKKTRDTVAKWMFETPEGTVKNMFRKHVASYGKAYALYRGAAAEQTKRVTAKKPLKAELPPDPLDDFLGFIPRGLSNSQKSARFYTILLSVHDGYTDTKKDRAEYILSRQDKARDFAETLWWNVRRAQTRSYYHWIKEALLYVEKNLRECGLLDENPEKPAETNQDTAPAKRARIGASLCEKASAWLWKLYEKTLKVLFDAFLERVWPK